MDKTIVISSKEETLALAKKLSKHLCKGSVITLSGDLGAGKTTFVSGVAKSLGITEKVTSPTFNILKCYFHSVPPLYHIDAYRLENGNKDIGLEEFIEGNGACFIEWPIFIKEMIPEKRLEIVIHNLGDDKREFVMSSNDERFASFFEEI